MQRLDKLLTGIDKALFQAGAMVLVAIVVITIWDVVARNSSLHAPIWLSTFVEFALPAATMLAAPFLVRVRGHVAMELIDNALGDKARRNLIRLTDLVASLVCGLVTYFSALAGLDSFYRQEMIVLAIDVPRWLPFAFLCLGFSLCAIEFFRHLFLSLAGCPAQTAEE